jgi:hypothetical protein
MADEGSKYRGAIIKESLQDAKILDNIEVIDIKVTDDENPADQWSIYTVLIKKEEIDQLIGQIKVGWYMHFWQDRSVIVVFKDKKFEFNFDDQDTWGPVVKYGLSQGIPKEQLDFVID